MKIKRSVWIRTILCSAVGIVFVIIAMITDNYILRSIGIGISVVSLSSVKSLWKLHNGDKEELDRYRAGKDERTLVIWEKAAFVAFFTAFWLLMATAFVYLICLDLFLEGLVIFAILVIILITFFIAVWYYSKKF